MHTPDGPCPTLTVPSDPRMLSVARTFVEAVCRARHVDPGIVRAAVLATGEAVTNIVRHAHRDRPDAPIQIQCRVLADGVELTFLDDGELFDLSQVPELDPAELRVGGRGVYLMRVLMDEITCQPRDPRGNRLRLMKRWAAKECG
jgi:serine/threonine-protein kinase RsbW